MNRRSFLKLAARSTAGIALAPYLPAPVIDKAAEWGKLIAGAGELQQLNEQLFGWMLSNSVWAMEDYMVFSDVVLDAESLEMPPLDGLMIEGNTEEETL